MSLKYQVYYPYISNANSPRHLLPQGRALLMLLDLTCDQRGCPDGGKMVFASTAPASTSSAATTCRRRFLLGVDLWLIWVIVDVVMALKCWKKNTRERKLTKLPPSDK